MTSSKALTSPEQPSVYLNRAGLYQQLLAHRGVVPSISRKGNCYDTAPVESFFSSLKNELVRHRRFAHQAEARYAIAEYREVFYNRQRLHQALGYRSPEEFERQESEASFTCLFFRGHLTLTLFRLTRSVNQLRNRT